MKTIPLIAIGALLLGGCDRTPGPTGPEASTGPSNASPAPLPGPAPSTQPTSGLRDWQSGDGSISLHYPDTLVPTPDFSGTYFTPEGWRAMFDGSTVGDGAGQVRFTAVSASGGDDPSTVTDILQIGTSDDAAVLSDCLTRGLAGGNGVKQPDRTVGGVRFTVYSNGDAGMSHRLTSTDLRAVHDGECIAIDRLTSSVPSPVDAASSPDRTSAEVERDMDAVLSSITFD